eukprot:gnl/TRDRNA2_/TRDRNA2_175882_c2_seq1.p2 gnl/TRDRNA2_/TRDRNA2_175882_c2~~gnl/TRDRNA2_/TRDRNA2_175882_c2_seq1.p2  ORF type:complete len:127 (+),score=8.24 gnl/TRDRNA2_/TRDRNA2_175882_c2_seq1:270-650(+)
MSFICEVGSSVVNTPVLNGTSLDADMPLSNFSCFTVKHSTIECQSGRYICGQQATSRLKKLGRRCGAFNFFMTVLQSAFLEERPTGLWDFPFVQILRAQSSCERLLNLGTTCVSLREVQSVVQPGT